MNVKCLRPGCGFEGPVETFPGCPGVYADLCCPQCGTTRVDTSEINLDWKSRGMVYGYGDDNSLSIQHGERK
jgi:hypothetical protein